MIRRSNSIGMALLAVLAWLTCVGAPAHADVRPKACTFTASPLVYIYNDSGYQLGWLRTFVDGCGSAYTQVYGVTTTIWTAALATRSNADVGSYTHYGSGATMAPVHVGCVDVQGWAVAEDDHGNMVGYANTNWRNAC
ncbi:hypothetical protein [Actinoallomurus sp. CA-150999]|uniref:hypothetical protein n=1 Tax=Actinoallomurus sp. CA-150999 TaxID=3239887 RepID=UPI003D90CBBC